MQITGIKDHRLSDDGTQVIVKMVTRYVGDLDLTMPTAGIDDLIAALNRAKSSIQLKDPNSANQVRVVMPKTWMVTADVKTHAAVIVIFDHQLESRVGFAINPDAAKKIAASLSQNADAVLSHKDSPAENPRG